MSGGDEEIDIENISEDEDFIEAERKMKEFDEELKKKGSLRPHSVNRPESAHHGIKPIDRGEVIAMYAKFSNFVNESNIKKEAFYPKPNAFLTKEEFAVCFQNIGYSITADELAGVWMDLGLDLHDINKVELRCFFEKLTCWRDIYTQLEPRAISNLNLELLEDIERKGKKLARQEDAKQSAVKPQSAIPGRRKIIARPFSSSTKKSEIIAGKSGRALHEKAFFLKQAKLQEEKELTELENIIQLGRKKQAFDCLHKIREACKIAKNLGKPFTFTTTSKGDAGLEIIKVGDDKTMPLSYEEFTREHRKLKREENSVGLKQGKQNASRILPSFQGDTPHMTTQNKDSKKEKQKKLLEVLKDTMKLTQVLKDQLKILEEKGVYGGEKAKK